jgi:hypothetical protein
MRYLSVLLFAALLPLQAQAIQGLSNVPSLPTGSMKGFKGSVGAGFTDFNILSPHADFEVDRGLFLGGTIERSFNVLNLYLSLGLAYMNAQGTANYNYTDLSKAATYSQNNVNFTATFYELTLGLKCKLIDDYWFKPYIEGGGVGSYYTLNYDQAALRNLSSVGDDYKKKDVIMGSGYYGEAGLELEFTPTFGMKLGARQSTVQTKKLDTLAERSVLIQSQTFFVSAIFGF